MKKRVVAVLLSLSMCMATAAEATVASAADFSAEIAVTEGSEESVTDEEVAGSEDIEDNSTVTIEDETSDENADTDAEVISDAEVTEAPAEEAEDTVVDFSSDVDFSSEVNTETAEQVSSAEKQAAVVNQTYPGEQEISSTQAKLSYLRWKDEEDDNGKVQWKLYKYTAASVVAVGETESVAQDTADAAETAEPAASTDVAEDNTADIQNEAEEADTETTEETIAEPAAEESTAEETVAETAGEATTEEPADDTQAPASEEPLTEEDAATAVEAAEPAYYTNKDGLVQITTLDANGNAIFTAKYAFDANGYLCSGEAKAGNNYYYFNTVSDVKITNTRINPDFAKIKTPYNSKLGQMQVSKWYWNKSAKAFRYYNKNGVRCNIAEKVYKVDNDFYYLRNNGVPFVGEKSTTYNGRQGLYWFKAASNSNEIPGKMARNTWIGVNKIRWRYFGNDGRYVKKGVGAYKVLNNSSELYLLDANGYIIRSKQVKAADGYYYMSAYDGTVFRNSLVKIGNYRYYFTSNGRRATWRNRWVQLAGTGSTKYGRYYYFGSVAGRVEEKKGMQKVTVNNKFVGWFMFTNGGNNYQNIWSGSRYFLPDGRMASGLTNVGGKYYFFQRSSTTQYRGQMYKGTWIKYNNKYYYAASNGLLATSGWRRIRCDGKMYYFYFQNCAALTNRSASRAGTRGWLDSRGKFTTGWVTIDSSRNLARYVNPNTGKWYTNTTAWIDGVNYRFNKYGNRVYDRTSEFRRSRYYLECDRVNGVMTVYTDSSKKYPIKTIRVSVGNPDTPTLKGTFTLTRSLRWQPLMGPSWGQYGTHVVNGIFVHSVASGLMNGNNLPASEYLKLGSPASHGCIRTCVADAKWVFENCNGSTLRVFDGTYNSDECFKGPLGRRPITPLRGSKTFDPTDPNYQ